MQTIATIIFERKIFRHDTHKASRVQNYPSCLTQCRCRESSHKNRQVFYVHHSRLPSPHLVMAPITNKTISPSRVISKPAPKSDAHFKASNGSIEQQRKLQVWIEHLDRVGGLEGRLRIDALILGLSADHHNSMPTRDEDWSYGMKNWDTDLAAGKEGQEEKPTNGGKKSS